MPPGRRSISQSTVVQGTGVNHFLRSSGVVHARQTSSRGTSTIRSKKRSNFGSGICVSGLVIRSVLLDFHQVSIELIETAFPIRALFFQPLLSDPQRTRGDPIGSDAAGFARL